MTHPTTESVFTLCTHTCFYFPPSTAVVFLFLLFSKLLNLWVSSEPFFFAAAAAAAAAAVVMAGGWVALVPWLKNYPQVSSFETRNVTDVATTVAPAAF